MIHIHEYVYVITGRLIAVRLLATCLEWPPPASHLTLKFTLVSVQRSCVTISLNIGYQRQCKPAIHTQPNNDMTPKTAKIIKQDTRTTRI